MQGGEQSWKGQVPQCFSVPWAPGPSDSLSCNLSGKSRRCFPKNQGGGWWLQGQEGSKLVGWGVLCWGGCEAPSWGLLDDQRPSLSPPQVRRRTGPGEVSRTRKEQSSEVSKSVQDLCEPPQYPAGHSPCPSKQRSHLGTLAPPPHIERPLATVCVQVGRRVCMCVQLSVCLTQGHL